MTIDPLEMQPSVRPTRPGPSMKFFPGWYVVAALFVVGFMLYGGGLYAFILFVPPLAKEFHWSSAGTGGLVSAFWICAPLSLFAAPLVDRFGGRRLVIAGILIESLSLAMLFLTSSLWQMYLFRALAGLGKILFAITLPLILSKWFSRHFALAAAIMYSGWSLGGLGLAPLTQYLLSTLGWRMTSTILGVAQVAIALPVVIWGLRYSSAEEAGLSLDGDADRLRVTGEPADSQIGVAQACHRSSIKRLVKLRSFQFICVSTPIYYLSYGGVLLLQAAIVEGSGASPFTASTVVAITAGCAALGAIGGGYVYDRVTAFASAVIAFSFLMGGILCLLMAVKSPSFGLLIAHAVVFGLGIGCGDIFWISLIKRRLPVDLFPTAWGIWYFLQLAFLILAPACGGAIADASKSYSLMLTVEVVILVAPLLMTLFVTSSRGFEWDV